MKKSIFILFLALMQQVTFAQSDLTHLTHQVYAGVGDSCAVTSRYAQAKYAASDAEKETLLCSQSLEGKSSFFATCPKLVNTNPGVEVYLLDASITKSDFENKYCAVSHLENVKIPFKKIGKFKSTVTCSYAPSILSYYHLSRYFGNILNVPPAVVRQVSPDFIIKQADRVPQISGLKSVIKATWNTFKKLVTNTSEPRSKFIYNQNKIYGALVWNPTGEEDFLEYMNDAGGDQVKRAEAFKKEDIYIQLSDSSYVKKLLSSSSDRQNKIERMVLLKDFSDMIVLDTLLSQEDRYNNIAYKEESIDINTLKKIKKEEAGFASSQPMKVKRLLLKDNDCGVAAQSPVARTNINAKTGIINGLTHMRPQLYAKLQQLAQDVLNANFKKHFLEQALMTPADYKQFEITTTKMAKELKAKCQSGALKLDLDLSYIDNVQALSSQSCE